MTVYYADPEAGVNLPFKTRDVGGEHVPGHDVVALPGTAEADIAASKTALETALTKLDSIVGALGSYLATIAGTQSPPTANYGGKQTVATAGNRAAIAASQALTEGVWVRALDANTGLIYVGNSTISSTAGGTRLAGKESVFIRIDNLSKVYVDSAVNGEGVTFLGW